MTVTVGIPKPSGRPSPASAPDAPAPSDVPRLPIAAPELQSDDRDDSPPPSSRRPGRLKGKRRALAALVVLALAALAAAALRSRSPPALSVQTGTARKGPITRVVSAAGKLEAAAQVKLSASVSGELVELAVREGDPVKKGQVLGRIDPGRYGARVAQEEANSAGAAAEVELERVKVQELARQLARLRRLARTGDASAAEVDRARSDLGAARARLRSAEERVEQARGALSEAQHTLSLTVLSSPIDGIVTERDKTVGERVRGSDLSEDVILVISALSSMEARMEVGEHEVVFVKEGDAAEVEIDAFPDRRFPAKVVEVARHATVKNAGTEGEVTTYDVRLALTAPVPGALPGMSAQATIATETHQKAVVVPLQAVTVRPAKDLAGPGPTPEGEAPGAPRPEAAARTARERLEKCVFVVERGVARVRPVETGLASETELEITSGLSEGEEVVLGPYRLLSRELTEGKSVTATRQ